MDLVGSLSELEKRRRREQEHGLSIKYELLSGRLGMIDRVHCACVSSRPL